jgi:hypothetical protein
MSLYVAGSVPSIVVPLGILSHFAPRGDTSGGNPRPYQDTPSPSSPLRRWRIPAGKALTGGQQQWGSSLSETRWTWRGSVASSHGGAAGRPRCDTVRLVVGSTGSRWAVLGGWSWRGSTDPDLGPCKSGLLGVLATPSPPRILPNPPVRYGSGEDDGGNKLFTTSALPALVGVSDLDAHGRHFPPWWPRRGGPIHSITYGLIPLVVITQIWLFPIVDVATFLGSLFLEIGLELECELMTHDMALC